MILAIFIVLVAACIVCAGASLVCLGCTNIADACSKPSCFGRPTDFFMGFFGIGFGLVLIAIGAASIAYVWHL